MMHQNSLTVIASPYKFFSNFLQDIFIEVVLRSLCFSCFSLLFQEVGVMILTHVFVIMRRIEVGEKGHQRAAEEFITFVRSRYSRWSSLHLH